MTLKVSYDYSNEAVTGIAANVCGFVQADISLGFAHS